MAAPTRRRHGHVAGLRRRPFNPTMVDKPAGVIEEPDEDEAPASAEMVEDGAAGAEDVAAEAVDDPAEDTEDDVTADVDEAAEVAQAEPELVVDQAEPEQVAEEPEAEAEAEVAEPESAEITEPDPAEPVSAEAPTEEDAAEEDPAQENAAEEDPAREAAAEDGPVQDGTIEEVEAATATTDDVDREEESVEEGEESEADRHADLFAWLAGDGESLADLLGPTKQPETDTSAPLLTTPPTAPASRALARPPRLDRESFRRATDAPRAAAPVLTPPAPPRAPRTDSPPAKRKHRGGIVILVAAIVVAAAVIAGVIALLVPGSGTNDNGTAGRGNSTSPIPPPVQTAQPVVWVKQNLPSGAAMIAPASLVPSLQAAGFTTVYADDALRGLTLGDVKYVVGEPAVTPPAGDLEKFVNATAPLAYFGTGSDQTMVGVVFAGGMAAMAKAMVADTKLRAQEGSQLLTNPNVHTDVAMRKVLANGLLDARAGALVASLANAGPVTVASPVRSSPEAAAGLPYRMFTVSMSNSIFLDNSLRRADPKYKPASAVAVGPNQRRLTWTPAVAPDKPFR